MCVYIYVYTHVYIHTYIYIYVCTCIQYVPKVYMFEYFDMNKYLCVRVAMVSVRAMDCK